MDSSSKKKKDDTLNKSKTSKISEKDSKEGINLNEDKRYFRSEFVERQWLRKHGKKDCIRFEDQDIVELRKYFQSLDTTGNGSIGVKQLEDPLIALGLAQTREEVIELIESVDDDGSGEIEFPEFLSIMTNNKNDSEEDKNGIYLFFKKMIHKELTEEMEAELPFKLNVALYRRRKILDSIMYYSGSEKQKEGLRIRENYKQQLYLKNRERKLANGELINDISLDQIPNDESGSNTRNGIPPPEQPIIKSNKILLQKPKSSNIQNNANFK